MNIKKVIILGIFILILVVPIYSQNQDWRRLIALESTREEVEKILGKSDKYFETYGTYHTATGKFAVWYSKGGCHKNVEGLQYNVPARKMTRLLVYLDKSLSLETYISNIKEYEKQESPGGSSRYLYTSPDETTIYQTIMKKDGTEFVYTIEIQPSKNKQQLLCKNSK
jgi:hypothetical protein